MVSNQSNAFNLSNLNRKVHAMPQLSRGTRLLQQKMRGAANSGAPADSANISNNARTSADHARGIAPQSTYAKLLNIGTNSNPIWATIRPDSVTIEKSGNKHELDFTQDINIKGISQGTINKLYQAKHLVAGMNESICLQGTWLDVGAKQRMLEGISLTFTQRQNSLTNGMEHVALQRAFESITRSLFDKTAISASIERQLYRPREYGQDFELNEEEMEQAREHARKLADKFLDMFNYFRTEHSLNGYKAFHSAHNLLTLCIGINVFKPWIDGDEIFELNEPTQIETSTIPTNKHLLQNPLTAKNDFIQALLQAHREKMDAMMETFRQMRDNDGFGLLDIFEKLMLLLEEQQERREQEA